jgi:preprotein translocase subunit YajC
MYTTIFLQMDMSSLSGMLPFLLMFVVIYLFMIRPQMKRQKNEKKFQASIAKGNKVITTSGIHGKITAVDETTVTLEVATGVKIKINRPSVSEVKQ